MRSKQQPRPSYRWLKNDSNDDADSPEDSNNKPEADTNNIRDQTVTDRQHHNDNEHDIEHSIPASLIQDPNVERDSPRCVSRESSGAPRCPSDESVYSSRSGMAIPATLPPSAASALLPPHSAAVAAYLGVAAAAAAHQQRLLMSESMDTDSESLLPMLTDPERISEAVLDFSTKRSESTKEDDDDENDAVNLSKTPENSPLDLSVSNRKRCIDSSSPQPTRKSARPAEFKAALSPWVNPVTPHLPYFAAAVAAAGLSPKSTLSNEWNGKNKHGVPAPSDATKALEKMSELSRLGGEELFRSVYGANLPPTAATRSTAWQTHWLNKGADQTKDVLKCVWCKKSFNTLAEMTIHMKEAKHCGVNVPTPPTSITTLSASNLRPPTSSPSNASHNSSSSNSSSKPSQNDLNLLIKETMPLPRKLVRGQDVWLGKGAEQTRQILKCMWCAESFRSLAEMTSHMQRTQHYTNIISQEQIISWKSSDESKSSNSNSTPNTNSSQPPSSTSSHVSAVLTCKVCDQAFSSLKELSNHMVKNSHYKEHMRTIFESGGRRRQTREKRKKSLPVRKLLELERAQHDYKNGEGNTINKPLRDIGAGSRINCEKCGDKIETALFVDHIRQCIGSNSQRQYLKNALASNTIIPPESPVMQGRAPSSDGRHSVGEELPSPSSGSRRSPASATDLSPRPKDNTSQEDKSSSPSVLNAIEQLIEKSFHTPSRHSSSGMSATHAPIGSSILKRLGIDESVDYTKPLVDPQTMNVLRSYHQVQSQYGRRERSGSESSSMSERGSGRVDALTPDRKPDLSAYRGTPRSTPDKKPPPSSERSSLDDRPLSEIRIKKEITDEDDNPIVENIDTKKVQIKREIDDDDEQPQNQSGHSRSENNDTNEAGTSFPTSPRESSHSPSSDRSATPRNTERKTSSSLGALSSMFDNLGGSGDNSSNLSRRSGSHPLAALQKLCDKTETTPNARAPPPQPSPASSNPGAILQFSWACNDGVISDSIVKCAYCDTTFISKGAYRHHLSKMHFVKDGTLPESSTPKNNPQTSGNSPSPGGSRSVAAGSPSGSPSPSPATPFDESPHSKFLKYTELAKQLSSKYI